MDDAELKAIRERLIAERDAARQDRDEWKALHGRAVHEMQARLDQQERENAELRRAYEHACAELAGIERKIGNDASLPDRNTERTGHDGTPTCRTHHQRSLA